MEQRAFGRSGLKVSLLGFGCGAVGGLMVRGSPADQERAIGRALDEGVTYFDTASAYGDGASERNLGRALRSLSANQAVVGTKVRLRGHDFGRIGDAVRESLDGSLTRLGRDRVDILYLHNAIAAHSQGEAIGVTAVLEQVAPAIERLIQAGKLRVAGFTAVGETPALRQVMASGRFRGAQVVTNLLNPSSSRSLPPHYPAQDYDRLLDHAAASGVGTVGIRVLAGGALSGSAERHPIASPAPAPIGSAMRYEDDLARAQRLMPLMREGFAASLAEAATRFAASHPAVSTILVGMATLEQFEQALSAVRKGPLPQAALDRVAALQQQFAGEAR
jgi:L-galactose dehydrogenase/L-glyceraldehyde 3-phosphate reductase